MRLALALALFAALLAPNPPFAAQSPFCDQLRALTKDPAVASAHWGLQVTDLKGTPLCSVNEAQLFRPASNNKIFTTATALALLGPAHTITTRLEAEGEIGGSTLRGNLLLIGAGDANFGSQNIPYLPPADRPKSPTPEPPTIADIEDLADQIIAKGIHVIQGDIVGDDTYFAWQPYPPDWDIDDMVFGYGAPISALTVHDNAIDITISPTARASEFSYPDPTVSLNPEIPYYALDRHLELLRIDVSGSCDDRIHYTRRVGSKLLSVAGDISENSAPCLQAIAIQDPAEYAALALKLALEHRGVTIAGTARALHDVHLLPSPQVRHDGDLGRIFQQPNPVPPRCVVTSDRPESPRTLIATHTSPPLIQDLIYTNKVSQNQHAEMLLRELSNLFACDNTPRDGLHVIREYLLHAGVDPADIALYDGSGLSTHDLVTPRAVAKFLAFAAAQPWFPQWKSTLPLGGVDGGLASRFTTSAIKTRVFAKTGTLGESRALSGYVTAASGQTLIFSILVDTHLPGTSADRTVMDRIVEVVAAQN